MIELEHCVDILLNTYARDAVVAMVDKRARERAESAKIVAALPPGIEQRTPAWYAARKGLLTASEFKIAGAASVSQSYVLGKVFPQPFTTNDAMTWGCRFEDFACATYETEHCTRVKEYGLLIHPDDNWLGASPDGITEYGVLLEIKCPSSRKRVEIDKRVVDGRPFPKSDKANLVARYAPQVQGQMEVCDLDVCDFAVAHIDEVDMATFWQLRRVSDSAHRYAVVVDVPKPGTSDGSVAYQTSPLALDDTGLSLWLEGVRASHDVVKEWYVHMRDFGVTRVHRDRDEWARMRTNLAKTRAAIEEITSRADPDGHGSDWGKGNAPMFSADDGGGDVDGFSLGSSTLDRKMRSNVGGKKGSNVGGKKGSTLDRKVGSARDARHTAASNEPLFTLSSDEE
jgi:putative phage-type endonuclease